MIVRIDHVAIGVVQLQQGTEQFRRLGFDVRPAGTQEATVSLREDSIEISASGDAAEGIRRIVLRSSDLAADVAAMRARGVDVGDAVEGGRRTPDGRELRWKTASLGPRNPLPVAFIEHLTPLEERRGLAPGAGEHPNGAYALERTYIVTQNAEADAALYAKVLGMPRPPLQKGTVIMSNMAVFQVGPTGLGIVTPYDAGPAADALQRRGPGPFQALYRTASMGAAARWMQQQGLPPMPRGVRNTGEHAMLVPPEHACGAYIGFVGPE